MERSQIQSWDIKITRLRCLDDHPTPHEKSCCKTPTDQYTTTGRPCSYVCPTPFAEMVAFVKATDGKDPTFVRVSNSERPEDLQQSESGIPDGTLHRWERRSLWRRSARVDQVSIDEMAIWGADLVSTGDLKDLVGPAITAAIDRRRLEGMTAEDFLRDIAQVGLETVCSRWVGMEKFRGFAESFQVWLEILIRNELAKP